MDMESIEKYTSVSVLTVFATIRGWIGWLIVLYCVAMCTDWLTGTILAIKNAEWNSSKAREGLGGIIEIAFRTLKFLNQVSAQRQLFGCFHKPACIGVEHIRFLGGAAAGWVDHGNAGLITLVI